MDLPEVTTHSFVVKIWIEEAADRRRGARWRGHITHVPSGKRRYIQQLGAIGDFVAPYLEALGVRPGRLLRLRRCLRRALKRQGVRMR
jgi:hypothetical protein